MLAGIIAGFIGVWVGLAFSDVADYVVILIPSKKEEIPQIVTHSRVPSTQTSARFYGHY